ncbi:MAG TPA: adenosylmethionine--8-amino-7-oxononanoate transaminase [Syntrophorhabdaceae bacterium]|nr:adenosylmethionine--8-amino-7-oxononanoate transaminase [Syntrophorhabdaceae bacterium]HPU28826.1 adenosylmethionine--8-amino-7-oxononanoate transaminase [Syntrophorhabdaceae bacterium]
MEDKKSLAKWDKRYIWHPFTQMKDYLESEPLVIERGEGFYLIDVEGKRYIDGVSSLWVLVHGHSKKELIDVLKSQAETLCHSTLLGIANVPSILLAKKIVDITPDGLTKVFYSDNGSTSVEIALKMAYQFWQQRGEKRRKRFIKFSNAYHGDTIGSVSVGGIDLFHNLYRPLLFKTYKAPSPYCYRCPLKLKKETCGLACVSEFEKIVKRYKDEVCAVIIEPIVQGAAGMIIQPRGFLSAIWKISKENGLLFIADEVATGFGRTGSMFACEHEDVKPDFMCLSKSITGGYLPLAVTLTTEEVFNGFLGNFEDFKTFFHGHTYTGNPLACAVALKNLELYESEKIIEKLESKIQLLTNELKRFLELPCIGEVRQKGFMVGIELVQNKKTKKPYAPKEKIGQKVILEARKRGVVIRPLGDVIVLMPPLAIDEKTLIELVDITYKSIEKVTTL